MPVPADEPRRRGGRRGERGEDRGTERGPELMPRRHQPGRRPRDLGSYRRQAGDLSGREGEPAARAEQQQPGQQPGRVPAVRRHPGEQERARREQREPGDRQRARACLPHQVRAKPGSDPGQQHRRQELHSRPQRRGTGHVLQEQRAEHYHAHLEAGRAQQRDRALGEAPRAEGRHRDERRAPGPLGEPLRQRERGEQDDGEGERHDARRSPALPRDRVGQRHQAAHREHRAGQVKPGAAG